MNKSKVFVIGLVLISILPILFGGAAPTDNPIKKAIVNFVESPYYLLFLFVLYLVGVGAVAWNDTQNSRRRTKANDRLAAIELRYKEGDFVTVTRDCHEQLSAFPNDAVLHWYLALASFAQKDFHVARTHFLRAAEIDPRFGTPSQSFMDKIMTESGFGLIGQENIH